MTAVQGSVAYPRQASVESMMVLGTNLIRIANILESNANEYDRALASAVGRGSVWTGSAASTFEQSARRRASQSRRAAASARSVGEALVRHGHVLHQSAQQYEANARAELYLRERSPDAKEAIDGTITGQAQAVGSLATSGSSIAPIVRQATNDLRHLANKALPVATGVDRNTTSHGEFASDDLPIAAPSGVLAQIDAGTLEPDPDSRLGAYAATSGYPPGTVGEAVHNAIGTIYTKLGTAGQEQIGRVFNSPEARALYGKPLTPETSRQIAQIEYNYWSRVRADNPWSFGGNLGSAVPVGARDLLQRYLFSTTPRPVTVSPPGSK